MRGYTAIDYPGLQIPVGTKIKFRSEKRCYTVQASNAYVLVCNKPLNLIIKKGRWNVQRGGKMYEHEKTVLYTIVDRKEGVRGPENIIFGMGAETREQCEEMLERVTTGESEVSHRHRCDLDIEKFYIPNSYFAPRKKRV